MTALDVVAVAAHAALACLLGLGFLSLFGATGSESRRLWAVSYLAGQCVLHLAMLLTIVPGLDPGFALLAVTAPAVGGLVLRVRRSGIYNVSVPRLLAYGLVAALAVSVVAPVFVVSVARIPLHAWDARSIWFFHGKALFFDGGIRGAAFGPDAGAWSHPNYPLMIPAQAAWVAVLRGGWYESAARGFLLVNVAAYAHLLWLAFRRRGWSPLAATGAVVLLIDPTQEAFVSGYVDLHYTMMLLLALLYGLSPGGRSVTYVSLAWALNAKNESQLYVVLALLFWFAIKLASKRRLALVRAMYSPFARWFAVCGALPAVIWRLSVWLRGVSGGMQVGSRVSNVSLVVDLVRTRLVYVVGELAAFGYDHGLVTVAAAWMSAALICRLRQSQDGARKRRYFGLGPLERLWLPLAALTCCALVAAMFVMTPHPLDWHIETAALRLFFLPHALMTLAALLALGSAARRPARTKQPPLPPCAGPTRACCREAS